MITQDAVGWFISGKVPTGVGVIYNGYEQETSRAKIVYKVGDLVVKVGAMREWNGGIEGEIEGTRRLMKAGINVMPIVEEYIEKAGIGAIAQPVCVPLNEMPEEAWAHEIAVKIALAVLEIRVQCNAQGVNDIDEHNVGIYEDQLVVFDAGMCM